MKFRAYIEYDFMQSKEAKKFGDQNISGKFIDFDFKDLVGHYAEFNGKTILFEPLFTARELIIPWLRKGNIPELIKDKIG